MTLKSKSQWKRNISYDPKKFNGISWLSPALFQSLIALNSVKSGVTKALSLELREGGSSSAHSRNEDTGPFLLFCGRRISGLSICGPRRLRVPRGRKECCQALGRSRVRSRGILVQFHLCPPHLIPLLLRRRLRVQESSSIPSLPPLWPARVPLAIVANPASR